MQFVSKKFLFLASFLGCSISAHALDFSKIPDIRKEGFSRLNEKLVAEGKRPQHCTFVQGKEREDPVCYDGVLSLKEAHGHYADKDYWLGKPLESGNKAKENLAGLDKIINRIGVVYGGTEQAIIDKEPDLNLVLAGLFNVFNNAITDVEPYVLSIAKGHYDKATLKKLDSFMNVFQNGWNRSVSAMVKFEGITQDDADNSTKYYRQELIKIRHIITQLNKYYQ